MLSRERDRQSLMFNFFQYRKSLPLIGLSFLLSLMLATCSNTATRSSEIRIGLIAPFNGAAAKTTGNPTERGAKLAIQPINDNGGLEIDGERYNVSLIVKDDRDNPDEAVAVANELINQEKVMAIVGPPRSRSAIPVAAVAERARIPTISTKSTNPQTTANKKYVFRAIYTDELQGIAIARFSVQDLKIEKAAVLYDVATDYSRYLAKIFQQEFERLGGNIVAFEDYTTDVENFQAPLEKIRDSEAELIFLPNYAEEISQQAQKIQELGLNVTLIGGDSWGSLLEESYKYLDGAFFAEVWTADLPNPENKQFLERYNQMYSEPANSHAALTYDAVNLILDIIKQQGKADSESIREGLADLQDYRGATGSISYQGSGDPVKSLAIVQIKNNRLEFYKQIDPD
ncbi:MAG: ABC transporter substrate-binding protein [Cyanobacteria bacterium SBLK]|nr:ABC transporter substrate-binding protein [Cyanobacteria bacterium SBLK]